MSLVHPEVRVRAKATCAEVAWISIPVVEAQPLRIPTLADYSISIPTLAELLRVAEQALAKVEALLAEAAKHSFVPQAVVQRHASFSPGAAVAA